MSKKTFKFNATTKKFEAECETPVLECPIVKVYQAGIESNVEVQPNDIFVQFPESLDAGGVATMLHMGQTICNNCRFNAKKIKQR